MSKRLIKVEQYISTDCRAFILPKLMELPGAEEKLSKAAVRLLNHNERDVARSGCISSSASFNGV